jgi:hypothetical protein
MENFRVIDFQQERDFSRKLNATFEFLQQNFKALGMSLLIIAGPSTLLGSLLLGIVFGDFMNFTVDSAANPGNTDMMVNYFSSPTFWLQLILMFILLIVSAVVGLATVNGYMVLYNKKKTNQITVTEVWIQVQGMFFTYLGSAFLFFILLIIAYLVLLVPLMIMVTISPFLIVLGFLVVVGFIVYLMVSASLTLNIQTFEGKNFLDALIRSFKLINNGKWWSTFGLYFVLTLIVSTIGSIFIIPLYAILFIQGMHSASSGDPTEFMASMKIWFVIFITLSQVAQMLLSCLPSVGLNFQYFNLVELKESKGLMNQIENFGQVKEENRPEENF